MVSLDANEQFCSDHRCCEDCLIREVTCKDAQGQEFKKKQSYHKQVYAQLSGPELSVILDFEPMSHVRRIFGGYRTFRTIFTKSSGSTRISPYVNITGTGGKTRFYNLNSTKNKIKSI